MSGQGLLARAYMLRFLSILLNAASVYFTYRMAREIFPKERLIYLAAPMLLTMFPMYTFTGMSINSDNLAIPIFALFLWLAVRILNRGFDFLTALMMLLVAAAGLFTKQNTFTIGWP